MSLFGLLCHDVTLLRAATVVDRYGDTVKDWGTATRTEVRARVVQQAPTEDLDHREALLSSWVCFLPRGTDVSGVDRVEWDGLTFEVKGRPNRAFDRRREHHVELTLDIVEG